MSHKLPEQLNVNPELPPPAYSAHPHNLGPSGQVQGPSSPGPHERIPGAYPHRASSFFGSNATPSFIPPPPPHFGPTPLLHSDPTLGLLPYYDLRSPYAIAEATSRARWRFICASLWATGIVMWLVAVGTFGGLRDI
ncbi:uncharacterized protein F5147DRAFT_384668 [Suillus discolor]|uniref:Uncharacterized protein n=1 Tax=Suillus discolor TaxID=1912936 RepID=A0A9P7FEC5_9AGAM|nr:uncharacterized protein F5147DRAFT_384668 [Suillus discolor]KAG2115920.1 hypothetical protein F5147DRAFT_384668 [Suillus discolor]